MNIYQKDGKWFVEVRIDAGSTFSRPAEAHEIPEVKEAVKAEAPKPEKKKADK